MAFILISADKHVLFAQYADSAMQNDPHATWIRQLSGSWKVTMTVRLLPEEKPVIVEGIVAERSLFNNFTLYEEMHPAAGSKIPDFRRISYLSYNYNEQRWDYMSVDSRITAGIMFFINNAGTGDSIISYIPEFPHPGMGLTQKARGKSVFVRNVIIKKTDRTNVVKQYWRFTDGKEWLGMMYEYDRK